MTVKDNAEDGELSVSGKVDVVAYVDADNEREVRQHINEVEETDKYTERETVTDDKRRARLYYGDQKFRGTFVDIDELTGIDTGDLELEITGDKKEVEEWTHAISDPLELMVYDVLEDMIGETIPSGFSVKHDWCTKLKGYEYNTLTTVTAEQKSMRLLKTQENMTEDDLYVESDEEFEAIVFTFKLEELNKQQFERVDNVVITEIIEQLAETSWIDVVRTYNCKIEETEKGVCWNL
jgi:hypothetical protein